MVIKSRFASNSSRLMRLSCSSKHAELRFYCRLRVFAPYPKRLHPYKRVWGISIHAVARNFSKHTLGSSRPLAFVLHVLSERNPSCYNRHFFATSFRHFVRKTVNFHGIANLVSNVNQSNVEVLQFRLSSFRYS